MRKNLLVDWVYFLFFDDFYDWFWMCLYNLGYIFKDFGKWDYYDFLLGGFFSV